MPVPLPSSLVSISKGIEATFTPFPVRSKQAAGLVNNVTTEVTAIQFSDKIMVTISQEGRLGHWVSFIRIHLENYLVTNLATIDSCSSRIN